MPSSGGFVPRPATGADLAKIWNVGTAACGAGQAYRYANRLFSLFDLVVEFPEMARERLEFTTPVRIHPSDAHLVIYRLEGHGVEIIRALHGHQNLTA